MKRLTSSTANLFSNTAKVSLKSEPHVSEIINLKDVIIFQGKSVSELRKAFRDSVKDYLAFCKERDEQPEKPFSGKFVLRVPADLHRGMAIAAASEGKGLNAWAKETLEKAVDAKVSLREAAVLGSRSRCGSLAASRYVPASMIRVE